MGIDLSKGYPNVLLIGNGVLKASKTVSGCKSKSWFESITELGASRLKEDEKRTLNKLPYTICATAVADCDDNMRYDKYLKVFKTLRFRDDSLIKKLVMCGFDAILTTNYTYEIENVFDSTYGDSKNKAKYAQRTVRKLEGRRLLHTYNKIGDSPPIWHIHGEIRRKTSIVLTHDEYGRLISDLVVENKKNLNKYEMFFNDFKYTSWIDYFLMSNMYIVGLGMDFSEFDLWWLLSRRMREKALVGEITFLGPSSDDDNSLKTALSAVNVKYKVFNPETVEGKKEYSGCYEKIAEYIRKDISEKKEKKS